MMIRPWRSTKCPACTRKPETPRKSAEHTLRRAAERPGGDEQRGPPQEAGRVPDNGTPPLWGIAGSVRVEREVKEAHHEVRTAKEYSGLSEGIGHGERGNEHRRHRREHDQPRRRRFFRPHGVVSQPGVANPRPPECREQR